MGRPTLFTIELNNNNVVYFPGSGIEGKVVLELPESKKVQGVTIVLTAKAFVYYKENRSTGVGEDKVSYTVHFSDRQDIFTDVFVQLWGDGRNSQQIAAGKHEFPFRFQLPSDLVLPTSFEGQHGYIRYALTSRLARPWKFDHVATRAITINELVDINLPKMLTPLSSSNEKTLCCGCCASGPISLSVTIDRAGYCPGESIAISTEAENHSNRKIRAVRATLKQMVSYYGKFERESDVRHHHRVHHHGHGHGHHHHGHHHHHPHHHHHHHHGHSSEGLHISKIVQRIEGPGIEAGGTSIWNNELLPIPAIVPTINSCRMINLSYALTVTLDISNALDLHVTIPITIGNVPFKGGRMSNGNANTSYPKVESYQPVTAFPGSSEAQNGYVPPPCLPQDGDFTYNAAHAPINVGFDNYTMGETEYAPVYGFVSNYQFAPRSSNFEAVVRVQGGEN